MNYLTISYRYTYICTPFDKVVGEQQIGGAYVPLFFVKLVIFVIMKINYTYLGIGILILGAGFYLLNKSKSNGTPSQDSVKLDDASLNTFIKYLYDRGYSVEQLPEDLKKELTTEQIDKIREALKNYKP